ncbi:MAG: hypothetical protein Q4C93_07170 [Clostridia bacterium]|nr:hypothetical protein [Clostridia bacterium]
MKSILDFTLAALPWLIVGVSLAILFAKGASSKKKESKKTGDYGTEGMCICMCVGLAIGSYVPRDGGDDDK